MTCPAAAARRYETARSGSGIPGFARLPTHPGGVAERPMERSDSRDDGRFRIDVLVGLLIHVRASHDETGHSRPV
jgi:hypothetical protein